MTNGRSRCLHARQAGAHQRRAEAAALRLGTHRQRRQAVAAHHAGGGADLDGREQNVASHLAARARPRARCDRGRRDGARRRSTLRPATRRRARRTRESPPRRPPPRRGSPPGSRRTHRVEASSPESSIFRNVNDTRRAPRQRPALPLVFGPGRDGVLPVPAGFARQHHGAARLDQQCARGVAVPHELHHARRSEADADDHVGEHRCVHVRPDPLARLDTP